MLQTTSMQPPTIDDIARCARTDRRAGCAHAMLVSRTLSEIIGAEIWLKFENLQFTAAIRSAEPSTNCFS